MGGDSGNQMKALKSFDACKHKHCSSTDEKRRKSLDECVLAHCEGPNLDLLEAYYEEA